MPSLSQEALSLALDVEVISIGNELLIGKVENTNAYWLAKQLTSLGATVRRITIIQDTVDEIASAINEASIRRACFIITTGGLGPTFDDKTFQGIGKVLNQKLIINPEAYDMVKQKCLEYAEKAGTKNECEMTPPRIKMAIFPEGTRPVVNPFGTAPALYAKIREANLFALPGIPAEMKAIFNHTIAPILKSDAGQNVFRECSIFTDYIAESKLAPLIDRVMADHLGVYIKSHPLGCNKGELHLTIFEKEDKSTNMLEKAAEQLKALILVNGGIIC